MQNFPKTWTVVLSIAVALAVTGCGGEKPKAKRTSSTSTAKTEPAKKTNSSTAAKSDAKSDTKPAAPAAEGWGSLTGKFVYDGKAPEPQKINVTKDETVCGGHNLVEESLVIGDGGGVANVVIYVRTKGVKVHPDMAKADDSPAVLDNKNCRFEPHVMAYQVARPLELHNSDPIAHNTKIDPIGDQGANPLIPGGAKFDLQLAKSQNIPVQVQCNIHPWMSGWVLPRDNPYFAVTDKDGSFTIDNLPTGELEFQVWHEKAGYLDPGSWTKGKVKMTIQPGENKLGDDGVVKLSPKVFKK